MSVMPRILVVDDEPTISGMLYEGLKKKYSVNVVETGEAALKQIKQNDYDLVITDVYLPDLNGMEILKTVKQMDSDSGVIVITGQGSIENAVKAMKDGAYDFLAKGFSLDEIKVTVGNFFKYLRLVKENELLRSELSSRYGIDNIIGTSEKMQRVFETVEMVAPTNATVLIQGASGTGKELIAKAIHQCSKRSDKPFIKTNCAAIPGVKIISVQKNFKTDQVLTSEFPRSMHLLPTDLTALYILPERLHGTFNLAQLGNST
ncbi:sigma-54-dependent Fis family transcriptional regulator [candidate division KSB1 bacterium]|nr:sigma-54-dependent Fis family transcriptional regulator [candidate division KSB1 bacterium]